MKVKEIKILVNEENKALKDIINVASYLSIVEKKVLIDDIVEDCIKYDDNGLAKVDFVNKIIAFDFGLLRYTDIELEEDNITEQYDELQQLGVFNYVQQEIGKELYVLEYLLEDEIKQKLELENSIQSVLNKNLGRFVDTVDNHMSPKNIKSIIKAASKAFKDLDMGKLNFVSDFTKFNNGVSNIKQPKKNVNK